MTGGGKVNFQDIPKKAMGDNTAHNLEAPIILGVAVVGLLVGCAMYHMCYRRLCNRGNLRIFRSPNRGPSRAEIRATTRIIQQLYQMSPINEPGATEELRSLSGDSLPDYNDLPPSYSKATKLVHEPKEELLNQISRLSVISSTTSEDPPPTYEECKEFDSV